MLREEGIRATVKRLGEIGVVDITVPAFSLGSFYIRLISESIHRMSSRLHDLRHCFYCESAASVSEALSLPESTEERVFRRFFRLFICCELVVNLEFLGAAAVDVLAYTSKHFGGFIIPDVDAYREPPIFQEWKRNITVERRDNPAGSLINS